MTVKHLIGEKPVDNIEQQATPNPDEPTRDSESSVQPSGELVSLRDLRKNKFNHRRLDVLQRRHDHLAERVSSDSNLTFDEAERGALQWALRVLRYVLEENN